MSEARALTNFTGNAVATVLIGTWVKEIDGEQVERVLSGSDPFDEQTMNVGHGGRLETAEPDRPVPATA
jgi:aerobic C4-dicarboxylate transport protein